MPLPESLPCARGGAAQSPLPPGLPCARGGAAQRRRGWKPCGISHYRSTPPSSQPLSQPTAASSPCTGEPISARPESLPCVRGGAAQRRWGWQVCAISHYRAKSYPHLLAVTGGGFGVSFWCEEESCSRVTVAAPFPVLIQYPILAKNLLSSCELSVNFAGNTRFCKNTRCNV